MRRAGEDIRDLKDVRVTDAKEVGVGNPAEETFYHPNTRNIAKMGATVKPYLLSI